jgi:hypothetical protein
MPYLHWDTDYNRVQATQAIKRHHNSAEFRRGPVAPIAKDEFLIRGYLNSSTDLHLRRTLDQFKHHSINTEKRDRDQVVFRFCKRAKKELKIFMVDQMWIWILGDSMSSLPFLNSELRRCLYPQRAFLSPHCEGEQVHFTSRPVALNITIFRANCQRRRSRPHLLP